MYSLQSVHTIIEQTLKKEIFLFQPNGLYAPVDYTLSLGGKRMRPALLLLACDLFGGDVQKAIYPALGIEIFHNFTLLHDDIMDQAPIRRGKETVYQKWNTNTAILSGDAMFIFAYKYLIRTSKEILPEVLEIFNKAAIEVCEGQQYDMDFETMINVSISDYIEMIRLKTAVLLGASLRIGAVISENASDDDQKNMYLFGENIGLAFQLKDDLLDVFGDEKKFGKKTGGDIASNKKTFLLLKAFELADENEKKYLHDALVEKNEEIKIKTVKEFYSKLNVKTFAEKEMDKYFAQAMHHLNLVQADAQCKVELITLAENLMVREF